MRVSKLEQYIGGADNVNALSVIRGEQYSFTGVIRDPDTSDIVDTQPFTLSAVAEFYQANVTITGSGDRAEAAINSFSIPTTPIADKVITVTKAIDTTTGQFSLVIPFDLVTDDQTATIDSTDNVTVAVIYITYDDGGTNRQIRKSRVVVIVRHSA